MQTNIHSTMHNITHARVIANKKGKPRKVMLMDDNDQPICWMKVQPAYATVEQIEQQANQVAELLNQGLQVKQNSRHENSKNDPNETVKPTSINP